MADPKLQTREEIIADLRAILAQHLRDWRRPWPGQEFGKTIIGNSLLGALERYGCDRAAELTRAMGRVSTRG